MPRYKTLSGNSAVVAYEVEGDAITVEFADGGRYRYTCDSAGRASIEIMKRLAAEGRGLSTYISRHARKAYAAKLRRS